MMEEELGNMIERYIFGREYLLGMVEDEELEFDYRRYDHNSLEGDDRHRSTPTPITPISDNFLSYKLGNTRGSRSFLGGAIIPLQ